MKKFSYILLLGVFVFTSCGQKYEAHKLITKFMDNNMKDPSIISDRNFSKIDSTFYVTDSMVNDMKTKAKSNKLYKENIHYTSGSLPGKIIFIKVWFKTKDASGKEQKNTATYYLDKDITRVIAFK